MWQVYQKTTLMAAVMYGNEPCLRIQESISLSENEFVMDLLLLNVL